MLNVLIDIFCLIVNSYIKLSLYYYASLPLLTQTKPHLTKSLQLKLIATSFTQLFISQTKDLEVIFNSSVYISAHVLLFYQPHIGLTS